MNRGSAKAPGEDQRGPGVRIPPPLIAVAAVGSALGADRLHPLPIAAGDRLWWIGIAIVALAFLLALVTLAHFLAARTHVEPWRPTSVVIQNGVFHFSRNPIYLSFCIAAFGAGLILDSWWGIAAVPLLGWLLLICAIRHEEAYLEAKFGEPYLDYKRAVRRWL
jgi:protein-S-isoprenylcysteine O-methyltransferase Ste14